MVFRRARRAAAAAVFVTAAAVTGLADDGPSASGAALRDEAIAALRELLEEHPDFAPARVDLARALFERGDCARPPADLLAHALGDDCDAARHHFRRALAGNLPPAAVRGISLYLALIRARRRFSGSFALAVAPDSNVNGGTETTAFTHNLFGLPFEFSVAEEQRARSGIGVVVSASGEYRHPLARRPFPGAAARLAVGVGVRRSEHAGARFDDMTVSLHAGPALVFPRGHARLVAVANRHWQGARPLADGLGFRIEARRRFGARLWLGAQFERVAERRRDEGAAALDGPRLAADVDAAIAVTPALAAGIRAGWRRARTDDPTWRSRSRTIGAFISADLPPAFGVPGIRVRLSHDLRFTRYDRLTYALFDPHPRRDRTTTTRLTLSSARLAIAGFAPALALVQERRESSLFLFDYRRTRAELTMRRVF